MAGIAAKQLSWRSPAVERFRLQKTKPPRPTRRFARDASSSWWLGCGRTVAEPSPAIASPETKQKTYAQAADVRI